MWILLIAAAAAPIPVRVTLYDGCIITSLADHCAHLVFGAAVYCCMDRIESKISSLPNCSAPAQEETCATLVITTYNTFCCNTAPTTDTYDDRDDNQWFGTWLPKNTYNDDINDEPWFDMDDEQWLPNWAPD